jgi:hypothetical protein
MLVRRNSTFDSCRTNAGQTYSVSEIEFCTLYVVAERWILGRMLRFVHAKNHFSDTLRNRPPMKPRLKDPGQTDLTLRESASE